MARILAEPPADIRQQIENGRAGTVGLQKRRARHSKTKQIREIKKYQSTAELILPSAPFERLVREIAQRTRGDIKFQTLAVQVLQEAAEAFIVTVMEDGLVSTIHSDRVTLMRRDLALARRLRDG